MTTPVIANVAQVSIIGTYQGQSWTNVLHFAQASPGVIDAAALTDLLDLLDTTSGWHTGGLSFYSAFYRNVDSNSGGGTVIARGLTGSTSAEEVRTVSFSGANSSTDASAMLALCVKWGTGVASRNYRGRTYLAGVNVGMLASGDPDHFDAGVVIGVANDMTTILTNLAGSDWRMVIASPTLSAYRVITDTAVNPVVAVQRRRRPTS